MTHPNTTVEEVRFGNDSGAWNLTLKQTYIQFINIILVSGFKVWMQNSPLFQLVNRIFNRTPNETQIAINLVKSS
jgi:hypothetical protein